MVKNRQRPQAIQELDFAAPAGIPAGIEVIKLSRLSSRISPARLALPRRLTFHHLIAIERGQFGHTVDFVEHVLSADTWVWVRPGQVQQWGDLGDAEGTLILFKPEFPDRSTVLAARLNDPYAPVLYRPGADDQERLRTAGHHLATFFGEPGRLPLEVRQAVLRHLLGALLLQLGNLEPGSVDARPHSETFLRFRASLERNFASTHRLEEYAAALGYSPRTLSRATQTAVGVNGKEFIDRRIVLEAQRLLAHGDQTAARIAAALGFSSATNFSKYFTQRTGLTPMAFRAGVRPG